MEERGETGERGVGTLPAIFRKGDRVRLNGRWGRNLGRTGTVVGYGRGWPGIRVVFDGLMVPQCMWAGYFDREAGSA